MAMPLHRLDENRTRGLSRLPQIRSEDSQTKINAHAPLRHKSCVLARSRSLAWIAFASAGAARACGAACYRNELVEDPPFSKRPLHAYRPAMAATSSSRVVMLTCLISAYAPERPKGANQMRQQVYIQAAFQARQCAIFFQVSPSGE